MLDSVLCQAPPELAEEFSKRKLSSLRENSRSVQKKSSSSPQYNDLTIQSYLTLCILLTLW